MRNLTAKFNLITKESGLYRTQILKIVIIILTMRIAALMPRLTADNKDGKE